MRILFLLLVLINLGYFMWQWPQHTNDTTLPSGPLPVTPNSKILKMLSEITAPAATAPAKSSPAPQEAPAGETP
jgi:hypothetical protein